MQEDVKGLDFILQLRPVTYQFDTRRFDNDLHSAEHDLYSKDLPVRDLTVKIKSPEDGAMAAAYTAASSIRRSGFIAQEVEQAAKKTGYNFSGIIAPNKEQKHYSLSYDAFVVPLVKAVQEQQQLINELQKTVDAQQKVNEELKQAIAELKKLIGTK